jgi:hypothetical protein
MLLRQAPEKSKKWDATLFMGDNRRESQPLFVSR